MTVEITEVPGPAYAWDSAGFAWTAVEGGKTWGSAHVAAWDVAAGETLPLARTDARRPGLREASAFAVGDYRTAAVAARRAETLGLAETYVDYIDFVLGVTESLHLAGATPKTVTRPLGEGFEVADAPAVAAGKSVPAALTFGEMAEWAAAFRREIVRALGVAAGADRRIAQVSADAFALAEAIVNADVPDVRDRGTASIPAGGTPVAGTVSWSALGY